MERDHNPHQAEDLAYEVVVKAENKILRRLLKRWMDNRTVKHGNAFSKEWNRQYIIRDNNYEE